MIIASVDFFEYLQAVFLFWCLDESLDVGCDGYFLTEIGFFGII